MTSLFTHIDTQDQTALLPKVQVAATLYRHHNALLSSVGIRNQIANIDADVGLLLNAIYDRKLFSWQDLIRWMKLQEQTQDSITVQVTNPQRFVDSPLKENASLRGREDLGLFALGKGKIYKRTVTQDIDKLLR